MMRRLISFIALAVVLNACSKNPITGRNQLKLLPESQLQSMATTQYQEFLSTNKVIAPSGNRDAEMVVRVGQRITKAVTDFYAQNGRSQDLEGYKWEYKLVDSKEVNAWCMPVVKSLFIQAFCQLPRMKLHLPL